MKNEIYDKIIKIIADNYIVPVEVPQINTQTQLVQDLAFESIKLLELVVYLEEEFGIEFDDDRLTMENFETIGLIVKTVENLLQDK